MIDWEKVIIPGAGTLLFFLLSGGFALGTGGATRRIKIILRCATLFAAGMTYSMAWHKELAGIFQWESAWIATTVASALGSVWLGKVWFAKHSADRRSGDAP